MGALDGVRVVDLGGWVAGPLTAMLLADQGAKVIHIGPPDSARGRGEGLAALPPAAIATLNRGKQCVTLDLKSVAGLATLRRLIASADILVENFRPGVMERLGLAPEALLREHPRLIACSLPGFAADDPRAGLPAWEGVIAAATGAHRLLPGSGSDQPVFTALHLPSVFGALAAASAIVMALIARERDGLGQRIEAPLFDAMFLAIGSSGLLVNGAPAGGRPDDAWSGRFECADGRLVQMNLATPRFRRRFMEAAGLHDWLARGYDDLAVLARGTPAREHQAQALRDLFRSRPMVEWAAFGREAGLPLSPILTAAEWLAAEHPRRAGIVVPVDDPEIGPMLQSGPAVRLFGTPGAVRGPCVVVDDPVHLDWPRVGEPAAHGGSERAVTAAGPPASPAKGRGSTPGARDSQGHDAPRRPALDGVRVLDVTQVLAGPTATRTLAEFGADVVKLNNPWEEGAGYRWNVHRYHTDVNRGKRSILVDLKSPEGLEIFWRLARDADVVVHNFRPGAAERLGIGYEHVMARNPAVVYGTVSMFGSGGPWESLPGYEPNAQAVSGIAARMSGPPYAIDDYATGLLGAFAMGLALFHRRRTGTGQAVEAALARAATLLQVPYIQSHAGKRWDEPAGRQALGWGPLQRLYRAADAWFFLGAIESQLAHLAAIDGLGGIEGLAGAPLEAALAERFGARPAGEWVRRLTAAGVGAHAIVTVEELMTDPWVIDHGLSVTRAHRDGSMITTVGPPARLSGTPVQPGRPAPPPGTDAEEVLASIGLAGEIDTLVERRAITLS